ncbi:hypothetical protein FKR46_11100 [Neisseria meningitidis]|nr:hypothetical protein [Neisseria meningitidis]
MKLKKLDSHFRGNDGRADSVAPDKCCNLKSRHSRAGGNLDLRTTVIFKDYLKVRDSGFPLSWE